MENHLLRAVGNEDYICKIFEEVIVYNPQHERIDGLVTIVEKAEMDLY